MQINGKSTIKEQINGRLVVKEKLSNIDELVEPFATLFTTPTDRLPLQAESKLLHLERVNRGAMCS